jgi:hypothetical protein
MRSGSRLLSPVSVFAFGAIALCASVQALAQDSSDRSAQAAKKAERLEEMKTLVRSFKLSAIDGEGKEIPVTVSEEPCHSWTDPTRDFHGGALWVWRASGRPVAVLGLELYASWSLEFAAVSPARIKADDGSVRWNPRPGALEFHEIPEAPAPGRSEVERLLQIRELIKRFSAREHWVNPEGHGQHYALRLLSHPIDRYSDPGSGVVDGAIFVFANGTNPESLVIIEARRHGDDPPKWSFAAVPFSHAEVTLKFGSRDVWTAPSKDTGKPAQPDDPYYDTLVPRRTRSAAGCP